MKLQGKVAIVTGAARGIGKRIALAFAREGAQVCIADLDEQGMESVSAELKDAGCECLASKADISMSTEVNNLVSGTVKRFGTLDILVNNAAYVNYAPFIDFDEAEWDKVMAVGLKGYFLCSQAAARVMLEKRAGKIISLASIGGVLGFPMGSAYCASKGGVIALTNVMAVELGPYGLNVNAIAPGPTNTELFRAMADEAAVEARVSHIPLGRLGSVNDMAKAAVYLASEDSDFVNGHVLRVDGGYTAAGMVIKAQ